MGDDFSGADFLAGLGDGGGIAGSQGLVVGGGVGNCAESRVTRQELEQPLRGAQFVFGNAVHQLVQGITAHDGVSPLFRVLHYGEESSRG